MHCFETTDCCGKESPGQEEHTGNNDEHRDGNILQLATAGLGGCDHDATSRVVSVRFSQSEIGKVLSQYMKQLLICLYVKYE